MWRRRRDASKERAASTLRLCVQHARHNRSTLSMHQLIKGVRGPALPSQLVVRPVKRQHHNSTPRGPCQMQRAKRNATTATTCADLMSKCADYCSAALSAALPQRRTVLQST